MSVSRLLMAPAVSATLLLGTYTGAAMAQPAQDPPDLIATICAAADIGEVNAALSANLSASLPAGVRDAVNPGQAAGPLEQVRSAAGCAADEPDPTTDPEPTTDAPAPTTEPEPTQPDDPDDGVLPVYYENCAAAIEAGVAPIVLANGEPGYRPALDSDDDGIACEADEADAGGPDPTTGPSTGSDTDNSGTLGGSSSSGSGSGSIDSTPRGSIDTGYVAG